MEKVIFTAEELEKCEDFANNVDTSFYARRNQWDVNKRKIDARIGKLGEIAVYRSLIDKYPGLTYPDFKIYKPREKSWDFDLKHEKFNLHVKTQETLQATKFGESWIFQFGDGKKRNYDREIFDRTSPNQFIAFVKLNLLEGYGLVRAIVSLDLLHDKKLFAEPVLDKLKYANKVAVYYKDLEKYKDQLWQL